MKLERYLNERKELVDRALDLYLPPADSDPRLIHEAMRYSAINGGKRIRPVLTMAATEAAGGSIENALPSACAIEMIHAFSLIHDDLPCMDDDDLRRGKPTSHCVFGEAVALLAGDALFALAFQTIARAPKDVPSDILARVIALVAEASGTNGMVGGQVLDLLSEGKAVDLEQVRKIHSRKTGALIKASVVAGGEIGGASPEEAAILAEYGEHVGLAFQIADDILDVEGEEAVLGKKIGVDAQLKKATYPATVGLENSKALAREAAEAASASVKPLGKNGTRLAEIAEYIVERNV